MTDSMARWNAIGPQLVKLENGWFITYRHNESFGQEFLWLDESGHVLHEHNDPGYIDQYVLSAHAEGANALLTEHMIMGPGQQQVHGLVVHAYDPSGALAFRDTLFRETLEMDEIIFSAAVHAQAGELLSIMITGRVTGNAIAYDARVIRYSNHVSQYGARQEIVQVPAGAYLSGVSAAPGPTGSSVLAFSFIDGNGQIFRAAGFDEIGDLVNVIDVTAFEGSMTNGSIDVLVANETVYFEYALQALEFSDQCGAYVRGVPLSDILGFSDSPSLPQDFTLSVYPNPFNSTASISFGLIRPGHVTLTVYDALGRRVTRLIDRPLAPGTYSARFDGAALSSGEYFLSMGTGGGMTTRRLVLIK